jgi:hypothetical protein
MTESNASARSGFPSGMTERNANAYAEEDSLREWQNEKQGQKQRRRQEQ